MKQFVRAGAVLAALLAPLPALADVQDFVVRNHGGVEIFFVYVSPDYSGNWEEDVLGDDTIAPGGQLQVEMSGYGEHCLFDIRIEDANAHAREYRDVDLCRVTYIDFP